MPDAIFFDLDGTLTDPKVGITRCIRHALEQLGVEAPPADELVACIGPPLLGSFERLLDAERAPLAVELYRSRFGETGLYENELYDGIEGVLRDLRERGTRLFVASSKPLVFVEQILDHFALDGFFEGVFGSQLDGTHSDKSELLAYALNETQVPAARALMVGDRSHDAVGAAANGLEFVGALYGYGSIAEFRDCGVTRWVERPPELVEATERV